MMIVSVDRLKKDGKTKYVKLLGKGILALVDHLFWNLLSAASRNPALFDDSVRKTSAKLDVRNYANYAVYTHMHNFCVIYFA